MRCTSGWIIILLLMATAAIGAKEKFLPAPPGAPLPLVAEKTDAAIEQLIKDLGSEDYRTREKAGRELIAKGERVLPSLKAALSTTDDPEVQRRLLVMVRKMDYDRLVTPKSVKMSLKDKTAKEALAEISRQTGYKIEYVENGRSAEPKYTFEFDNVPFWQALDKVATTAGCVTFNDYNDDSIQVSNQESTNPYVAYAGSFRFLATNINSNKNVQLSGINRRGGGGQFRQEFMNLNFQIQSEPKNPMLGITQVDLITAADEFGGSLIPPKDPNNRMNFYNNNGVFRGHNTYGGVNLSRSDKTATTIKTLKAKVGIILLSGTVPEIVITDPLKVKNKTFTGRTVEIEFGSLTEVANQKGHYQLEVTIKKLGVSDPDREDFNWVNSIWQKIEVIDSAGKRYQTYGANNFNNNNGTSVQLTIPFDPNDRRTGQAAKLGPPVKVLINEWLSVLHEVTFEFKDIPLP